MTHYGRPKTGRSGRIPPHTEPCQPEIRQTAIQQAAGRVLALGGAMMIGFFLLMTVPQEQETVPEGIPEGAVAAMSMAVTEKEAVILPSQSHEEAAGAEPFGYMDGEWNLWEYIGDLMWSLLS